LANRPDFDDYDGDPHRMAVSSFFNVSFLHGFDLPWQTAVEHIPARQYAG
jgi:hypothetical protein